MVAIIKAIVGGSVFFCEKVGFEKGAQKGQPRLSFGVPQMGPGTPQSRFRGGSSENIQFFHDWAFLGKSQLFEIAGLGKKRPLRSKGRPRCPSTYWIGNVSDVLKFCVCVFCFRRKSLKPWARGYQEPLRSPRWPPIESLWPMDLAGFSVFRKKLKSVKSHGISQNRGERAGS